jgi:hypothetical protein
MFDKIRSTYPNRKFELSVSDVFKSTFLNLGMLLLFELIMLFLLVQTRWMPRGLHGVPVSVVALLVLSILGQAIFLEMILVFCYRLPTANAQDRGFQGKALGTLRNPSIALALYFAFAFMISAIMKAR